MNGCVIPHQTPTHLRVRLSALAESECNPAWLESWLEAQPGVKEVRINSKAASVVAESCIRIEAQRVGSDTTTARVASFIQSSLENRSDTQRLADELADQRVWFTLITGGLVHP
jgi:Mg-chelatase subunit ChlI